MSIEKIARVDWSQKAPINIMFDDPYYSLENGEAESNYVFLKHNNLEERFLKEESIVIGETGFGTGLNFFVTAQCWLKNRKRDAHLTYFSIEKYPISISELSRFYQSWPQFSEVSSTLLKQYPENRPGIHHIKFVKEHITLVLMIGDVCEMLDNIIAKVDAWYFDGFSPMKNKEMWSEEVFHKAAAASHLNTSFSTFTAAGFVRRNIGKAGFGVKKSKGFGKKREMIYGELIEPNYQKNKHRLPWYEISKQKSVNSPVVIIGAGVSGLSCALALAEKGIDSIIIDSASSIADGASGNPAAIILPKINLNLDLASQYSISSFTYATHFYNEMKLLFPDLQWVQNGVLQFDTSHRLDRFSKLSLPENLMLVVDGVKASKLTGITCKQGALYFKEAGTINPHQLCETMLEAAGEKSKLVANLKISSIEKINNEWLLKTADNKVGYSAEQVIIANASDASRLLNVTNLAMDKNRGQLNYFAANEESNKLCVPLCGEGYLIPAHNNMHVVGATYGGEGLALDSKDSDENWSTASSLLSGSSLDKKCIPSGRVSYRATTIDHLPIVGPVIDEVFYKKTYTDLHHGKPAEKYKSAKYQDGLFISVGHGSRGLVTCIAASRYLASLISGSVITEPQNIIEILHPGRFLIRALKKKGKITSISG